MQDLIELEEQGWQALSTEGDAAWRFYEVVLTEDANMLLPGGLRLEGKAQILESLAAQPWQRFQIEAPHVLALGEDAAALLYKVTAQRAGSASYTALVSSTYVRHGQTWQMALHQQTPV